MPFGMLLIGLIAIAIIREIEIMHENNEGASILKALRMKNTLRSGAFVFGIIVLFVLFAFEVYFYAHGRVYQHGIAFAPIVRLVLIIALSFISILYKINSKKRIIDDDAPSFVNVFLILFSVVLLIIFFGISVY